MTSVAVARAYQQSFETHPYGTVAITNGALNALGDMVAQLTEKFNGPRSENRGWHYDIPRTLRFAAFGFGMGPIIGRWNFVLERYFPLRAAKPPPFGEKAPVSLRALGKRVAADQLFMAPIGLAIFIGSMGIMEGRDKTHIRQKYSDMFVPAIITNWQVWPLAQFINFRFMPLAYRVPFQSSCGVFWTLYLSILNSREDELQDRADAMRRSLDK
ncbi:hypothetical protein DAEQUDRAFT_742290 [Daedalea quercina L-15889]|uniref:Uncharacterized protein n=1 Tax=Daedalea quercina L-15889 TaxID=1314783 RepID=A0A165UFN4_9APHY|nr:hypothetical protein DAEQUDRAFT_742290 [Daedalea quercina L-15889]